MLTPEESALLQRHVSIDGDGNVVGNDNTVQVTKLDAKTYVAEVKDQRVTFTVQDLRRIHVEDSQAGVIGDNATVHGGIHFIKKVITSPWAVGLLALGVMLLGVIALANLPGAREQLPLWLQPRAFPKEQEDEVLIVIAQFHTNEGVVDTAAHDEIKRAIEQEAGDLNLRVEVAPTSLEAGDREGAQALGDRYDASLIIWGADTGVRVSVNFYNREQPDFQAADVRIEETARTQIAAPSEYAEFVIQDLPQQLAFLALFAVGQSYYADEDYEESVRVIEKAVAALEESSRNIEGEAEAYFRMGWLSYGLHSPIDDLDGAHAAYTQALELNPENAAAYNNRGAIYEAMGEYGQALTDYTRALELNPEFAVTYYNRGITYHKMGEYEQALADYTQTLEINPEDAAAHNNRGVTYKEMGEYAQALTDYNQALELNPEFATVYNNRGNAYQAMGEYEQSLVDYAQALELSPEYAAGFNNRGNTYFAMGEYERALVDYNRALELNPEYAKAYNNRGNTYFAVGEYEQALADYTRALDLNPEFAEAYYNRGVTYEAIGEYEQALADYNRALELNPGDAEAYNNRGNTYQAISKYEQALSDYKRAADLVKHHVIYYNSAIAHIRLGHTEDACAWLAEAISLDSVSLDYARTDPAFNPIRDEPCFQALMNDSE